MLKLKRHLILLSPDEAVPQEVDPLASAASGFEAPKYPVLAAGRICLFKVKACTREDLKEDKGKENPRQFMVLNLITEKDYTDKDGKPLRAGFPCFKRIGLYTIQNDPKQRDRDIKQIGAELAEALRCFGKPDISPRDWINNPSLVDGNVAQFKTSIKEASGDFPESNNLKFVPPA